MPNALRPIRLNVMMGAALLAPAALSAPPAMPAGPPQGLAPLSNEAVEDDELLPVEEDKSLRHDGEGGYERVEEDDAGADRDDFEDEGLEEDDFEHEDIPLDRVPKPVLAAFKKQFGGGAEVHSVYAETEDGHAQAYFIEGEAGGGGFAEMTVGADGEVYGYAHEIDFKKAPKPVRSAAIKAAKGNRPDEIYCALFQEDETYYHVALEFDEESGVIELMLAEDGTVLEQSRSIDPSSLPANILKLLKEKVGSNARIEEALKVESIDEMPHYVVMGIAGNQGFEFFATSDGGEAELELYGLDEDDDFEDEEDEDFEDEDDEDEFEDEDDDDFEDED